MKKILSVFIALLLISFSLLAQTDDELAVQRVIDQLFTGMAAKDSSAIYRVMLPNARLQSALIDKNGKSILKSETLNDFAKQISGIPAHIKIEERILFYDVKVDGNLAQVWAEYQFFVNDKMSHCGVDAFQLFRNDDGIWKIFQITDTRRKENCD